MSSQKTMVTDLTRGNILHLMLRFSAPLILANILQMVYNLVDMVVVGQVVGSAGIAAVANGGDVLMLVTAFSMGCCSAGQIIISQYIGRNDRESVNRTIGTMLSFMVVLAIVLMIIALILAEWGLKVINTPAEAFDMAMDYTSVCFVGLVFIFGYNAVSSILRGMGDGKRPLIFIAIATVVNIVLDLVFIAGLGMGAFGAALATVIGQGVSFLFSLVYLYKNKEAFGFDFKLSSFKINLSTLGMLLKLGLPMALQSMAIGISSLVVNAFINSYGVIASAVAGIGAKLRILVGTLGSSVSTASSTMIGQNTGAGLHDRVRSTFRTCMAILLSVCTILGLIGMIFPEATFRMFDSNPEVLAMAPKYMVINFVTFVLVALMQTGMSLVNGIGHARLSFIMGIVDGIICRIGLVVLFGTVLDFGIWGIWWGAALPAGATAIISVGYYFTGKWKTRKPIIHS